MNGTIARVKVNHAERRRGAYPSITDQLDAIWKILATIPKDNWPADALEVFNQVKAIKASIPKPVPFKETNDGQHP